MSTPVALSKDEMKSVRPTILPVKIPTELSKEHQAMLRQLIEKVQEMQTQLTIHDKLLAKAASV